jgi:hypothetical protein
MSKNEYWPEDEENSLFGLNFIELAECYYHVAPIESQDEILDQGLTMGKPELEKALGLGVYLWDSIISAEYWLSITESVNNPDQKYFILTIDGSDLDEELIEHDHYGSELSGGAYIYRDNISPNAIEVYSNKG